MLLLTSSYHGKIQANDVLTKSKLPAYFHVDTKKNTEKILGKINLFWNMVWIYPWKIPKENPLDHPPADEAVEPRSNRWLVTTGGDTGCFFSLKWLGFFYNLTSKHVEKNTCFYWGFEMGGIGDWVCWREKTWFTTWSSMCFEKNLERIGIELTGNSVDLNWLKHVKTIFVRNNPTIFSYQLSYT